MLGSKVIQGEFSVLKTNNLFNDSQYGGIFTQFCVYCKEPIFQNTPNIIISNITSNSFEVQFTINYCSSYIVRVRIKDPQGEWITKITNSSGSGTKLHNISGLVENTVYDVQVVQTNYQNNICVTTIKESDIIEQRTVNLTGCPLPIISDMQTTNITSSSFNINFNISQQTVFTVQYKLQGISDNWISIIIDGSEMGNKSYTVPNLTSGNIYNWRVVQTNTGDCVANTFITNCYDQSTTVEIPICNIITNKPIIISPTAQTEIVQNTIHNIIWNPVQGTEPKYNIYIDGNKVNQSAVTQNNFGFIFTKQKQYTIQIGQYNDCTEESQYTKSTIVTVTANQITPCIEVSGSFFIITPNNNTLIELDVPYVIRWQVPPYGTNIKFNFYINNNLLQSSLSNNSYTYIFTEKKEYQVKVIQYNECTLSINPIKQEYTISANQFIDKKIADFEIYCRYGSNPGIEVKTDYIPMFNQDITISNSVNDFPIIVPNEVNKIVTTVERYFRLKITELQSNKKIKNFKIFCSNAIQQIGTTLYYKTVTTYESPKMFEGYLGWNENYNYNILQDFDDEVNLFVGGNQDGEITEPDTYTDYGVLLCEVSQDQVSTEQEFLIYIQWDDFEI